MKRFLALITAFFMSLSTSTDYTVVSDKDYSSNTYKVNEYQMPDYRTYFGGGLNASSSSGCTPINFNSNGQWVGFGSGYWFVDGSKPKKKDGQLVAPTYKYTSKGKCKVKKKNAKTHVITTVNGKKYKDATLAKGSFKDGQYIIAPFNCVLMSHSVSGGVTSMNLRCDSGSNTYNITIRNMKCWYCDINRSGEFAYHTSDEQYGRKFSGGNVLGIATRDTYIKVTPIGKTGNQIGHCSMMQFYKGSYKKEKKK